MNKRQVFSVGLVLLAAMALLGAPLPAAADHSAVNGGSITVMKATYDSATGDITAYSAAGSTDAYSPKATCAGCHITNCEPAASNAKKWCTSDSARTAYQTANPAAAWADYGNGTLMSTHVQGVLDATNTLHWQADQVKSFANGASVSYHMNQGRNEDYSNVSRKTYNDPFFTSSPGMFGKY